MPIRLCKNGGNSLQGDVMASNLLMALMSHRILSTSRPRKYTHVAADELNRARLQIRNFSFSKPAPGAGKSAVKIKYYR